jgi:predicted naringenin-chalcone synthase
MSDIKDNETTEKTPLPKVVVFDENNNVQLAEEGKTILAFVMGEDGVKIALNGYVTEVLLETLKNNMPNIMDNLIADFKKQAKKQDEDKKEDKE